MEQLLNFEDRHIGISEKEKEEMLQTIGVSSLEDLVRRVIPDDILLSEFSFDLEALSEQEYLGMIREISLKNKVYRSLIGQGYYGTHTPSVIRRNIFENPGWYTQYTPYQAEISQGRLEALFIFQTVVSDLTGLPMANASLLDEGTAAGEAITMVVESVNRKTRTHPRMVCYVHDKIFEQTKSVIETRTRPLGIEVRYFSTAGEIDPKEAAAVILQYPDAEGDISQIDFPLESLKAEGVGMIAICDLLSLTLLKSPGSLGFDVAVGTTQRFGIPMGYGGPHAGYMACEDRFKRLLPGRIIGLSKDKNGKPAYRMALQTREQHIKREKATSNICTAQALLAIMAGMYAVFHGPDHLKALARRIQRLTTSLAHQLRQAGHEIKNREYFDTISISVSGDRIKKIRERAEEKGYNFFYPEGKSQIRISLDELSTTEEINEILSIFGAEKVSAQEGGHSLAERFLREDDFLTHPVFHSYRSETRMMRYLKSLENKDLSLVHSMIPLGSCTMKLNAATELLPLTWPEFSSLHPFVPRDQAAGYDRIIGELGSYLASVTGLSACTFQPNSGAQGEYAGLLMMRAYHKDHGGEDRDLMLIPDSAHGTNPASAVLAGYKVEIIRSDVNGSIDTDHLREILDKKGDRIAGLMVTYPSTHGVFEKEISKICRLVHDAGGLIYMDGANMNAQIGYTSPGKIGADVCHLNLHKTFAIPHGGGGPGMGPVCVNEKLKPYLPWHVFDPADQDKGISAVSSAPYSSASILLVSYAYIRLLGAEGLKKVTQYAILNANYLRSVLSEHYPVLYTGAGGKVAHELILDLRPFREYGIEAEDVAKRLIDYGFHAPTLSFPVPGTLMVEPTESEDKKELDRFCEAMIQIRKEIDEVAEGKYSREENVLVHAPHPLYTAIADEWSYPYPRSRALLPLSGHVVTEKYFCPVARVEGAYGDRNLICTCPPVEAYVEGTEI